MPKYMEQANVEALAKTIRQIRNKNDLTRIEMAHRCGVSVGIYKGFEDGNSSARMAAATLIRIAMEFEVSIDYLLGLTSDFVKVEVNKEIPQLRQRIVELELIETRYNVMRRSASEDASKNARLIDQNNKLRAEIMSLKQNPEGIIKPLRADIAELKKSLEISEARVSKLIDKL